MINVVTDLGLSPSTTYSVCQSNTAALKTWLANTANWGKTLYFPCTALGAIWYITEMLTIPFHHVIGDPGSAIYPLQFAGNDPVLTLNEGFLENIEVGGNRGGNPLRTSNCLIQTSPVSQPLWHPKLRNVKMYDFPHTAVAHNFDSLLMENCIIIGQGSASVNGSGVGTSSLYGVWGGSNTCELTVQGGLYDDMAWGAIYGSGTVLVNGAVFHNNHRQTAPVGGGHIGMSGLGLSCTVTNSRFINKTGVVSGASGLELDNCPWTCTNNYIEGMPGQGGIVKQGNFKHIIIGNSGKSNAGGGIVKTFAGTDQSYTAGNMI